MFNCRAARGQPNLLFVGLAMSKQWQHHNSTLKTTHHKVTITDTYLVSPKMATFELLAMLLHVVHQHENNMINIMQQKHNPPSHFK